MTDTDSTSLQFIIVSDLASTFPENNILFEIFSNTEIKKKFGKCDEFWKKFDVHMPENQKVLGLYEVESINDPCVVTLAVNLKEYPEYFQDETINKNTRGSKKAG